ncbi:MAG: hypothetical protein DCC72_09105 [Burkholderiales bacterium]|jgi:hypothetical protein|nr:MAG: hypothetical protein DCC72_09105 [Burkholderiales bacterium]
MDDEPTSGALPLPLVADIQEGLVAACNDLDRLRDLLDDAFGSLLAILPLEAAPLGGDTRTAVTSMQFHDLGVQLIAHTRKRLQFCADRLAQDAFGFDEDGEAAIEPVRLRANPVTCAEMDAGSVELFS